MKRGWGSPVRVIQAHSKWRSGKKRATVVQIEPRLSNTAAKADKWYPINPGTETTLVLGLAHIIIRDSLYDSTFINGHTSGFMAWKDIVMDEAFSPGNVSEMTGLSGEKIEGLARAFAKANRPLAVWGRGKGTTSGSLYECLAVQALNALVGNVDKPGGMSIRPEVAVKKWPNASQDATAQKGNRRPRLDGAGTETYPITMYRPDELPKIINENPDAIQVLLVHEADP